MQCNATQGNVTVSSDAVTYILNLIPILIVILLLLLLLLSTTTAATTTTTITVTTTTTSTTTIIIITINIAVLFQYQQCLRWQTWRWFVTWSHLLWGQGQSSIMSWASAPQLKTGKTTSFWLWTVLGQPWWLSRIRIRLVIERSWVRSMPDPSTFFVEIDNEIFSFVILSLPLSKEGQLSVSDEIMCKSILSWRLII